MRRTASKVLWSRSTRKRWVCCGRRKRSRILAGQFLRRFVEIIDYESGRVTLFDPSFEYHGEGIELPVTIDRQTFATGRIHKASGEIVEGKFSTQARARRSR